MVLDARLISHRTRARASRTRERDSQRWNMPHAMPDAFTELLNRLEQRTTQLPDVPHTER
jgi:hypothetical protein